MTRQTRLQQIILATKGFQKNKKSEGIAFKNMEAGASNSIFCSLWIF